VRFTRKIDELAGTMRTDQQPGLEEDTGVQGLMME
jgi:hypothetical protein